MSSNTWEQEKKADKLIDWINWNWSGPNREATEQDGGTLTSSFVLTYYRIRGAPLVCHVCLSNFGGGDWAKQWRSSTADVAPMTCKSCTVGKTQEELDITIRELLKTFRRLQRAFDPDGYKEHR